MVWPPAVTYKIGVHVSVSRSQSNASMQLPIHTNDMLLLVRATKGATQSANLGGGGLYISDLRWVTLETIMCPRKLRRFKQVTFTGFQLDAIDL